MNRMVKLLKKYVINSATIFQWNTLVNIDKA